MSDISSLKIEGGCFESETELSNILQDNINIVYGRNGSGKSTIAKAIFENICTDSNSCQSKFGVKFDGDISQIYGKRVFVYNEAFIESKVKVAKEGLETIVMLGDQADIKNDIEKNIKAIKELERCCNNGKEKEIEIENEEKNTFECIKEKLYEDREWAERDIAIRGKKKKRSIDYDLLNSFVKLHESTDEQNAVELIELNRQIDIFQKTNGSERIEDVFQEVSLLASLNEINSVLTRIIAEPKLTERDKIIARVIAENEYLKQSIDYFNNEDRRICPFCLQDISPKYRANLLETLEARLKEDAEQYKNELLILISKLQPLREFNSSLQVQELFDPELKEIQSLFHKINQEQLKIKDLLNYRYNNIYGQYLPINSNIETYVALLNDKIKSLNTAISLVNKSIEDRKHKEKELCNMNNALAAQMYYREIRKLFELAAARDRQIKENRDNAAEMSRLSEEISILEHKRNNTNISVKIINDFLSFVFFDRNRVSLHEATGCYKLKVRGISILPTDVSMGERNAIALGYFFASMAEGLSEEERYQKPSFVVMDDPVSSFDFDNRIGIISALRWQIGEHLKACDKSKFLIMSHDVIAVQDMVRFAADIHDAHAHLKSSFFTLSGLKIDNLYSHTVDMKKIRDLGTYRNLVKEVFRAACAVDAASFPGHASIGNTIRKMLEAYSSFVYSKGANFLVHSSKLIDKIPNQEKALFENCVCRLVLDGDSHMEERAKSLRCNDDVLSFEERKKMARICLKFLYYINPEHLSAYLGDDKDLKTISTWQIL